MSYPIEFTQSPKHSDFVRCAFYSLFSKVKFWVYVIALTLIYAVLYYLVGNFGNTMSYDTILNISYFFLLLGPLSLRYWISDRAHSEFVKAGGGIGINYIVSDEGIRVKTGKTDQLWRWEGVDHILVSRKYYFITLSETKERLVLFRERIPVNIDETLFRTISSVPTQVRWSKGVDRKSVV